MTCLFFSFLLIYKTRPNDFDLQLVSYLFIKQDQMILTCNSAVASLMLSRFFYYFIVSLSRISCLLWTHIIYRIKSLSFYDYILFPLIFKFYSLLTSVLKE
jgi:hypothetical protein